MVGKSVVEVRSCGVEVGRSVCAVRSIDVVSLDFDVESRHFDAEVRRMNLDALDFALGSLDFALAVRDYDGGSPDCAR